MTVRERLRAGKALRQVVPRAAHAEYRAAENRIDPVLLLMQQSEGRVEELVPVRHARMLASSFAFLRGSALAMAQDLVSTPVTGLQVQACGDVHLGNFGLFASAERHLIFGLNDFDETFPGPWEWDLKRLVTSAIVCLRFLGADPALARTAAREAVRRYRENMRYYAGLGHLKLWYSRIDDEVVLRSATRKTRKVVEQQFSKARRNTHTQVLAKLTELVNDGQKIIERPPIIVRDPPRPSGRHTEELVRLAFESYRESLDSARIGLLDRYRLMDAVRKVSGVGSVGNLCKMVFLMGSNDQDPLFLQIKQARPSALAVALGRESPFPNEGQRVVEGQRILQGAPDIFLGWARVDEAHLYVRQLRDMKGGVDFVPGRTRPSDMVVYCGLCGWALALAHAKSGDAARIAGYVGNSQELDEALAAFGEAYADQNEADYQAVVEAARQGRIAVDDS